MRSVIDVVLSIISENEKEEADIEFKATKQSFLSRFILPIEQKFSQGFALELLHF